MAEQQEYVQEKDTTHNQKKQKRRTKKRTERCSFCNKVDVIESGSYSKDLGSSNSDNSSEDEYNDYWFCCVLHNHMYKHKHGISRMANSSYNEEMKKLNLRRTLNRERQSRTQE